jgi:hypothetical protein
MSILGSTLEYPSLLYRNKSNQAETSITVKVKAKTVRNVQEMDPRWNFQDHRFLNTGRFSSAVQPFLLIADLDEKNRHCLVVQNYRANIVRMLRTYGLGDVADLQFPDIWLQSTGVKELERGLQEVQSSPGNASCKLVFLLLARRTSKHTRLSRHLQIATLEYTPYASPKRPTSKMFIPRSTVTTKSRFRQELHGSNIRSDNTSGTS